MLTKRTDITKNKPIISSELTKMQKAFYDEDILNCYKDDNEEHLYQARFDCMHFETIEYNTFNKIISLNHTDINTFTTKLSIKLKELFQTIKAHNFFVLSHLKMDFFGNRDNDFEPLVQAYKKLKKLIGTNTYKEAFTFNQHELNEYIDILFWTTRCDMSIPEYIFIFDENEKIQINLCKYGNLHLTEFNEERFTPNLLETMGWNIIEEREYDNFSSDGKIDGRQLKI